MVVHRAVTAETLPNGEALTIEELQIEVPEGTTSEDTEDGGVIVTFGHDESSIEPAMVEHDANLVEYMDDGDIAGIVSELQSQYEADKNSRQDWERAYVKGLEFLGTRFEERTMP